MLWLVVAAPGLLSALCAWLLPTTAALWSGFIYWLYPVIMPAFAAITQRRRARLTA